MSEHIPDPRLFCVVVTDNLNFTDIESNHLKECPDCFEQWIKYVLKYVPEEKQASKLKQV